MILAPGRQLQQSAAGPILVSRAGPVRLNASAAAILELCDGTRTREEIVAQAISSEAEDLADDVREFLNAASRRGWIIET